jgi:hypothetical protein
MQQIESFKNVTIEELPQIAKKILHLFARRDRCG